MRAVLLVAVFAVCFASIACQCSKSQAGVFRDLPVTQGVISNVNTLISNVVEANGGSDPVLTELYSTPYTVERYRYMYSQGLGRTQVFIAKVDGSYVCVNILQKQSDRSYQINNSKIYSDEQQAKTACGIPSTL